jgi:branched-chain amino acid transport system substrate-binding protein
MDQKLISVAAAILVAAATGASAQTRGVTKTEVVLGTHSDLSGVAATYGVSSTNAMKMRFEEINEAGGIHGRKIRSIVEDQGTRCPRRCRPATS